MIDNDYRGEIVVVLRNNTNKVHKIEMGQKIAQCIFEQAQTPCMIVAETLPPTIRDGKGFGSTSAGYNKTNKAEAIACALRVAVETQASIQAQSLSNNDDDRYSEFMRAGQEALPDPELENKHNTKSDKLHRAELQVGTQTASENGVK